MDLITLKTGMPGERQSGLMGRVDTVVGPRASLVMCRSGTNRSTDELARIILLYFVFLCNVGHEVRVLNKSLKHVVVDRKCI